MDTSDEIVCHITNLTINIMTKINKLIFAIIAMLSMACSDSSDEILSDKIINKELKYFALKNADGSAVTKIEPELRAPIYEDLLSVGKTNEAELFLSTYNELGDLIPDTDLLVLPIINTRSNARLASNPRVSYGSSVENRGWVSGSDDSANQWPSYYFMGTTDQGRYMEAYYINLSGTSLSYDSHLYWSGWQGTKKLGSMSGTTGQGRPIEAIRMWFTNGEGFVYYQSHLEGTGWGSWKGNGAVSGTEGQYRKLEAIRFGFYLY